MEMKLKDKKKAWNLYFNHMYSYDRLICYFHHKYPYSVIKSAIREKYRDTIEKGM